MSIPDPAPCENPEVRPAPATGWDPASLQQAAAHAAGMQEYPAGSLYVVATPIGNLADLSLRALHVLRLADAVACEDTRHSGRLLSHLGLSRPLLAVHQHNEREAAQRVIALLGSGQRVALVSDAGTPAVSDPGAALVAAVRQSGLRVIPVPGASSALAALSVAGDALGAAREAGFVFVGFAPARGAQRRPVIAAAALDPRPQILFEAPHRIVALMKLLAELAPERSVTLCRELTKQFEEVVTLSAREAPAWVGAHAQRARGEFVLVLHALAQRAAPGPTADEMLAPAAQRLLEALLQELPLKQAVDLTARVHDLPRKPVYRAALRLQGGGQT